MKSTGDGHLITFDGPTQAIRCAEALRDDAEKLGIEIRIGIHTGECELLGDDIGGIAVHIAARSSVTPVAGEILVSRTVRDLVVGSGTGFDDRGSVELRGVPGSWELLAVNRQGAQAGFGRGKAGGGADSWTTSAMRRSDRAVAVMAKRTPWILRRVPSVSPATAEQAMTRKPQISLYLRTYTDDPNTDWNATLELARVDGRRRSRSRGRRGPPGLRREPGRLCGPAIGGTKGGQAADGSRWQLA